MKKLILLTILFLSVVGYSKTDSLLFNKALEYFQDGKYINSIKLFEKSLIIEKDINDKYYIYYYISISHLSLGDYSESLKNMFMCLKINKHLNDKEGIGSSYNNIGIIYDMNKKYDLALDYYNKSLSISEELHDTLSIAASLNNISSIKINTGKYFSALDDAKLALKINEKYNQFYPQLLNHENIGNSYRGIQFYNKALEHHQKEYDLALKLNDKSKISSSYENIAEDYMGLNKYENAILYLNKSKNINFRLNLTYYNQVVFGNLSESYENINMLDSSLYYYKKYSYYKDSIFSKESQDKILHLDLKYKTKEKENKILKMSFSDKIQKKEIQKQKTRNIWLSTVIIVILIASFIILILHKTVKKALKINKNITYELKAKDKDITDSINYAKNIQNGILSTIENFKKNISNSFVFFKPKDILSGDFYWSQKIGSKMYLSAVDCTGHGIPGAMLSIIGHTGLTRCLNEYNLTKPSDILRRLNQIVHDSFDKEENIKDGMDMSLCVIDEKTNILECSMANNPIYIIRDSNKEKIDYSYNTFDGKNVYKIFADKHCIGSGDDFKFTNKTIQLLQDDEVYLFSDGFADQFGGPKGKKYKYKNFQNYLVSLSLTENKLYNIEREFNSWKDDLEQIDDVLVIGVKIK